MKFGTYENVDACQTKRNRVRDAVGTLCGHSARKQKAHTDQIRGRTESYCSKREAFPTVVVEANVDRAHKRSPLQSECLRSTIVVVETLQQGHGGVYRVKGTHGQSVQ